MKKVMFIWFFLFFVCLFHLSNINFVYGQQSSANTVFNKFKKTIVRPDILPVLHNALYAFKDSKYQDTLKPVTIDVYLDHPIFLRTYSPKIDDQFIALLYVDDGLRTLFGDEDFYKVLKDDNEIDKLLRLLLPDGLTISTDPIQFISARIGEQITIRVNIKGGQNINGYKIQVDFDTTALSYVEAENHRFNGDFLPEAYPLTEATEMGTVLLEAVSPFDERTGEGTLATLTFEVVAVKASTLTFTKVDLTDSNGNYWVYDPEMLQVPVFHPYDVTQDNKIDILDLVKISTNFGKRTSIGDVNNDGIVNIQDLVLVAGEFGKDPKKISMLLFDQGMLHFDRGQFTVTDVWKWLTEADALDPDIHTIKTESTYSVVIEAFNSLAEALITTYANVDMGMDGKIDISDLNLVAQAIDIQDSDKTKDVDGDGEVNVLDLILVAGKLDDDAVVISMNILVEDMISITDVWTWLYQAKALHPTVGESTKKNPTYQRGIAALEGFFKPSVDVNMDGQTNILDIIWFVGQLEGDAHAISTEISQQRLFSGTEVRKWLEQANALDLIIPEITKTDLTYLLGFAVLQNLVAAFDQTPQDVNEDGIVNIQDFNLVEQAIGLDATDRPEDVDTDGEVNILDLILVTGELGDNADEIYMLLFNQGQFAVTDVWKWLTDADALEPDIHTIRTESTYSVIIEAFTSLVETLITTYANVDMDIDGKIDITDLKLVAEAIGLADSDKTKDVDGDGVVNVIDLILVAGKLGDDAEAISTEIFRQRLFKGTEVRKWLEQANAPDLIIPESAKTEPTYLLGFAVLQNLVAAFDQTPEDVNEDGIVNIQDFNLVKQAIGKAAPDRSEDVDGNGEVNVLDLILVTGKLGDDADEIYMLLVDQGQFTVTDVWKWLTDADALDTDIHTIITESTYSVVIEAFTNLVETLITTYANVDMDTDGKIDITDLNLVAQAIAFPVSDKTKDVDVDGDGEVNVLDLILVAGKLGEDAGEISSLLLNNRQFSPIDVWTWLELNKTLEEHISAVTKANLTYLRGINAFKTFVEEIADVDDDGVVNIQDFNLVEQALGLDCRDRPEDVDGDGKADILDLILVVGKIGDDADEISMLLFKEGEFTVTDVWKWLTDADALDSDIHASIPESTYSIVIDAFKSLVEDLITTYANVDMDMDGKIDISDLNLVAEAIALQDSDKTKDVDGDGKVNVLDLILVAGKLGEEADAISTEILRQRLFIGTQVRKWLEQASPTNLIISESAKTDPTYLLGFAVLENLVASFDRTPEDVNEDGVVTIQDFNLVAQAVGKADPDRPEDVDGNGEVNVLDLILVTGELGENASEISMILFQQRHISAANVKTWIEQANAPDLIITDATRNNTTYQRGLAALMDLLKTYADVNKDGVVNIQDLVQVASEFGSTDSTEADVNGDGEVNILDLVKVASAFGNIPTAPSLHDLEQLDVSAADVRGWLIQVKSLYGKISETNNVNPDYLRYCSA